MKTLTSITPFVIKVSVFLILFFFLFTVIASPYRNSSLYVFNAETLAESEKKAGGDVKKRFHALMVLIQKNENASAIKQLNALNNFFNLFIFSSEKNYQGEEDNWKSPNEFIKDGEGDCEDFAIAKYFTAISLGIPAVKLRIAYVKSLTYHRAHMVLTYYPNPNSDPLVLDNLTTEILPASKRTDLVPVYSFNADKLWLAKQSHPEELGNSMGLNQWRNLIERMQKGR